MKNKKEGRKDYYFIIFTTKHTKSTKGAGGERVEQVNS
jgi:hypothetical protein